MKNAPLIFSLHSKSDASYSTLIVTVLAPKQNGCEGHDDLISFHWQSNASERHLWYGFHAELHHREGELLKRLQQAAKLVAKAMPGERDDEEPMKLIERLMGLGISRAAYDGRVSRYLTEKDAIDPAFMLYLDDWTQYASRRGEGCTVRGLALDDAHAKVVLQRDFLATIERGYATAEEFAAWVSAGRPVRKAYMGSGIASYPPIADLLHYTTAAAQAAA